MSSPPRGSLQPEGAILLISCYELGHAPHGIALPAGYLEAAGYRPALLDIATRKLDEDAVRRAHLIALSVPMHTALRLGIAAAERIRALNPDAHLCFYGTYAGLHQDWLLEQGICDQVAFGEVEPALLRMAEMLDSEALATAAPPAAATPTTPHTEPLPAEATPLTRHPIAPHLKRISFAPPSRRGLPAPGDYAALDTQGEQRPVAYAESSRGCKHTCLHCPLTPVYQGRFFVLPQQLVLDDIATQVAQGARHVTFGDPDFLNGPAHALAIARGLHRRFPEVTFDFTAKVEHLLKHAKLLPELSRLGCLFIISAVESLSGTVLASLNKGHTRADIERAVALTRDAGIALRPTWVAFTPWTTLADYREMLAFVAREKLVHHIDSVQYAVRLLLPPGSALLDTPQFAPYLRPYAPQALSHPWGHPDERMDALHARIGALVAAAAESAQSAEQTFAQVIDAAWSVGDTVGASAAHEPPALPRPVLTGLQPPAPRITEPWFC